MLVINQLIGEYECKDDILRVYHEEHLQLLKEFKKMTIEHVPKFHNGDANRLAQHASGYRLMEGVMTLELATDDWRKKICIIRRLMEFCSNASIKKKQRC